jgi:hypothetical protein
MAPIDRYQQQTIRDEPYGYMEVDGESTNVTGAEYEGMALGVSEGVENWNSEDVGSGGLNETMVE